MTTNLDVVRDYNASLRHRSHDPAEFAASLRDFLSDDTVCIEAPTLPWGGVWVGPSGFAEMFARGDAAAAAAFGDGPDAPPLFTPRGVREFLECGDVVFHRFELTMATAPGQDPLDVASLERYEVADGRISKIEVFFFDTASMAAVFRA